MAFKKSAKRLADTELCSQRNSNTDDDTGKWIECTSCSGWIRLTCSSLTADKFDLRKSSPDILHANNNCLSSSKKLTLTAAEVRCLKKDTVYCLNDKLSKPEAQADVRGKQVGYRSLAIAGHLL